jgi:hypothetical protein
MTKDELVSMLDALEQGQSALQQCEKLVAACIALGPWMSAALGPESEICDSFKAVVNDFLEALEPFLPEQPQS